MSHETRAEDIPQPIRLSEWLLRRTGDLVEDLRVAADGWTLVLEPTDNGDFEIWAAASLATAGPVGAPVRFVVDGELHGWDPTHPHYQQDGPLDA